MNKKPRKRKGEPYCERNFLLSFGSSFRDKSICYECHTVFENSSLELCTNCNSDDVRRIGPIARLPRKNASKQRWVEFFEHCGKTCAGHCR